MQNFADRYFSRLIFGIWLLAACAILLISRENIAAWKVGGPDDQMRLIQVRDWVAGQSWWDITQYRMNAPDGGDMHWSRLVDVPLGVLIVLTRPLLGANLAEQFAASFVPLLTLAAAMYFYALAARRFFGAGVAVVATGLVLTIMHFTTQMAPMRIDHHGWQIVCFVAAVWALFDRHGSIWSAIVLGLACALWIEISVEGLPFAAVLLGVSALSWIFPILATAPMRNHQFPIALAATAAGAFLLYSITESWSEPTYCDALSPVHIAALGAMAAIVVAGAVVAGKWNAWLSIYARVGVCTLAGVTGIATVMAIAPACASDAFAGLDPLVRAYWYNRTLEGLPLWALATDMVLLPLAYLVAGGMALAYVAVYNTQLSTSDKLRLIIIYVGSALIGALVSRTVVYAMIIANLFLAALLIDMFMAAQRRKSLTGRMGLRAVALLLAIPGLSAQIIANKIGETETETETAAAAKLDERFLAKVQACQKSTAAAALGQLPASFIMAGLDTNPAILQFTKHNVVASGHHRNDTAMADVIRAFTLSPDDAAQIIGARRIRFLVICDGSYELALYARNAPHGLLAQLRAGKIPLWLRQQPDVGPFQIFEVAPALLPPSRSQS